MTSRRFCDHHWHDRRKVLHVCQRTKGHAEDCQCQCGATDRKPAEPSKPPTKGKQ